MYLDSYFEYIGNKTYIDKYPKKIIDISMLNNSILVEFGGGVGNDMVFLISKLGLKPANLFFVEKEHEIFRIAKKKLEKHFSDFEEHLLQEDAVNTGLSVGIADFIYANNFLHCLEDKKNIINLLYEVKRILKPSGIFFGRTLSDKINEDKLSRLLSKRELSEKEEFWKETACSMKEGTLIGLSEQELEILARSVGFRDIKTREIPLKKGRATIDFYFNILK